MLSKQCVARFLNLISVHFGLLSCAVAHAVQGAE